MSELDDLRSGDGVLMAGRFGPDGRIAEHKSKGLFIEYPPALEMAQWFGAAATMMFNSMAFAMDSISRTGFDTTSWSPAISPTLLAVMSACSIPSTRPAAANDPFATGSCRAHWVALPDDACC